jgi:alkylation response protein AidB-like acyl-CoA dehydrogenase
MSTQAATPDRAQEGAAILAAARAAFPLIRGAADEIERGRTLPPIVVEAMRDAGVFRMAVPRDRGGPELDIVSQFEVIEAIAMADGSAGWCAYINSTSGYWCSWIDQDVARSLYPSIDIPTGGMPVPVGRAERVDGGYRFTGRWSFASGVMHCGWMVAGCALYEDGVPVEAPGGGPVPVVGFLSSDQFEVHDTWHAMGLRGSGSHDFTVTDLFVPAERTFDSFTSEIRTPGPLYALRGMFLFNHAAVAIGIGRTAIDEVTRVLETKRTPTGLMGDQDHARSALARATATLGAARAYCIETLRAVTAALERDGTLDLALRGQYRLALTHAHRAAVEAVGIAIEAAGTTPVVRAPGVLERCLRDIHVANQHVIASPRTYVEIGGMFLGVEPADPTY